MKPSKTVQPLSAAAIPEAWLTIDTVKALTGRSTTSIYRDVRSGKFPEPVKLSPRCTRWRAGVVTRHLQTVGGQA